MADSIASQRDRWCLIESDPGVFSELVEKFGVEGVEVIECIDISVDSLRTLRPTSEKIYGLILLFKYVCQEIVDGQPLEGDEATHVFFARQEVENACGTQALLSVLLNCSDKIDLGSVLTNFRDFTLPLDPPTRGICIGNCEELKKAHNSFASNSCIQIEDTDAKSSEDLFHFCSFVPISGAVYELDGLKKGPILCGTISSDDDWLSVAETAVREKIAQVQQGSEELRFTLLAVVSDHLKALQQQEKEMKARHGNIAVKLISISPDSVPPETADWEIDEEVFNSLPEDAEILKGEMDSLTLQLKSLKEEMAAEDEKRQRRTEENERRRHDFLPLTLRAMVHLAKRGLLLPAFEKWTESQRATNGSAGEK